MPELMELIAESDRGNGLFVPAKAFKKFTEAEFQAGYNLIENKKGWPSYKWEFMLREAITTTDFPYLFGQIIDRELLARYVIQTPEWRPYCFSRTLPDFRQIEIHKVQGGDESTLPLVSEKGEYLVSKMVDAHYHNQVYKRGRQFDISWEAIINDVMDAFGDLPQRYADAARMTEARLVTDLYASAAGPDVLLFGAPIADVDGQNVTNLGVLALTIANLETTLGLMAAQTNVNGEPMSIRGVHLVVPPMLETTARAILTSSFVQWQEVLVAGLKQPNANVLPQMGLQLHVDPYLPVVDTSANRNGTWYLFAEPGVGKAMEFDYLRGHEAPEICMKSSNKVTPAGGAISPFAGDFATDNIFYRVRIVCGGAPLDPRFAYAQVHT